MQPYTPQRMFIHNEAGAITNATLDAVGNTKRGEALMCVEFMARFVQAKPSVVLFTNKPKQLNAYAQLFPHVQFYVFEHEPETYDPDEPEIKTYPSNVTDVKGPFTRDYALKLGMRDSKELLLMVCQDDRTNKLIYHALARPNWTLMTLSDPEKDFYEGELLYPIHSPRNAGLAYIIVRGGARGRSYNPELFKQELGYFQTVLRNATYDNAAENAVLFQYAGLVCGLQDDAAWAMVERARFVLPVMEVVHDY